MPRLARGERLMTMAVAAAPRRRRPVAGRALVEASGVDPVSWLRSYLHAYVRPIVHCLLAHDLAFMPHGENLVLVLRDRVPVRTLMKDVGEEVAVMSTTRPLPEDVERIRVDVDQDIKSLVAAHRRLRRRSCATSPRSSTRTAWSTARRSGTRYAAASHQHADEHPELADAAATYDLFRPEFRHSCLNRLQLRNTLEMVDIADQAESLIYAGTLVNPIAAPERVGAAS